MCWKYLNVLKVSSLRFSGVTLTDLLVYRLIAGLGAIGMHTRLQRDVGQLAACQTAHGTNSPSKSLSTYLKATERSKWSSSVGQARPWRWRLHEHRQCHYIKLFGSEKTTFKITACNHPRTSLTWTITTKVLQTMTYMFVATFVSMIPQWSHTIPK